MSLAVFLFYSANLSWPMGYSMGGGLALATALWVVFSRKPRFDARAAWAAIFCGFMAAGAFWEVIFHGESIRELDLPSKFLGIIFLIWAGSQVNIKPMVFWVAVSIGSVSGTGIALHDIYMLGLDRATGFTGGIQFGNIGLILGIFSATGAVWAASAMQGRARLITCAALMLTCLLGLFTSLTSGSRGGWVGVPLVVLLFTLSLTPRRHAMKTGVMVCVLCTVAAAGLSASPTFQNRLFHALNDIQLYRDGQRNTSSGLRFSVWDASVQLIKQRPLAGWGDQGYRAEMKRGVDEGRFYPEALFVAHTHNTYLETWLKHGIFGITGLLGLLVSGFYLFAKQLRHPDGQVKAFAIAGTSLLSVYAVASITQIMLDRNNTLLFFVFSFAVLFNMMHARVDTLHKQ